MQQRWQRKMLHVVIAVLCSLYSASSLAHKLAPSLLQIDEVKAGSYQVIWRTPMYTKVFPEPVFPDSCREEGSSTALVGSAIERRWSAECEGGLEGGVLAVDLLGESRTVAMLRFHALDGQLQQKILTPEAPSYVVPQGRAAHSVFGEYVSLGIEHILIGADHLLFVTALLLLSTSLQTLLKTVTAFTLGHSVTLVLVSLGLIPNWSPLVEFLIATTILILALELSRAGPDRGRHSMRRHQWLVASVFGLVHGLGFADVLKDIGMPADALVTALLSFNIGIEAGQLMFVGAVAGLLYVINRSSADGYRAIKAAVILAMGGISVYWCLDRGVDMARSLL
jgi:hydrogenase/urease accessory protein HupE